jgi:hypothetical protein
MNAHTAKAERLLEQAGDLLRQHRHLSKEISDDGIPSTTQLWSLQRCRDELTANVYNPLLELSHESTTKPQTKMRISNTLDRIDGELQRQSSHGLQDVGALTLKRILDDPRLFEQHSHGESSGSATPSANYE